MKLGCCASSHPDGGDDPVDLVRDEPRFTWVCPVCGNELPDTEIHRLSRNGQPPAIYLT